MFRVDSPKTWSPDSPNLYDIEIEVDQDTVKSYTGFRTVSKENVNGVLRIVLVGLSLLVCVSRGSNVLLHFLSGTWFEGRLKEEFKYANFLAERRSDLPFRNFGSRCVKKLSPKIARHILFTSNLESVMQKSLGRKVGRR